MINLNEKVIAQWLRERAKLLNQTADALEGGNMPATTTLPKQTPSLTGMGTISVAAVRELVGIKAQRIKTLATHFNVPEYEVEKIIDGADSGLIRGPRGWIQLQS